MDFERLLFQSRSSFLFIRTTLAPTLSHAALEALSDESVVKDYEGVHVHRILQGCERKARRWWFAEDRGWRLWAAED
jgi:hypothetical protein